MIAMVLLPVIVLKEFTLSIMVLRMTSYWKFSMVGSDGAQTSKSIILGAHHKYLLDYTIGTLYKMP